MRTLLIGLDAATASILEPLFDDGELETLRGLWEEGTSGPLESQVPPWTASAWPSLYTGKNPGKHGVFGFLTFEGYDWDVVNATDVRARPIWEYLDYHGRSSVVVNAPITHPPRSFDGALIPGYASPEDPDCHPEGLLEEVRDAIGDYRIYAPRDVGQAEQLAWYRRLTRMRGEAFRELAARYDPDFGFVQFQQTDTVFHERPGDMDAVRAVYREVDEQVAAILDDCDPDTVIVASDHGMGEYDGRTLRVNEFLEAAGYVTVKRGGKGMPTWVTARDQNLRAGSTSEDDGPGALERAMAVAAKAGVTTERVAAVLDALGISDLVADHVPASVSRAGTRQVDFPASRAYMRDSIELGVRVNLEGREPEGVVPQSDYEDVREDLVQRLSDARTPDGDRVFADVARREKYFHGPAADEAVDVVTVPADFDFQLSTRLDGQTFGPIEEPWHHKMEGLVIASGEAVDTDASLEGAHLFDVAPTVLATFDLPADVEMDGEALPVVPDAGRTDYPEREAPDAVATDDAAVERRLEDLGYLEKS